MGEKNKVSGDSKLNDSPQLKQITKIITQMVRHLAEHIIIIVDTAVVHRCGWINVYCTGMSNTGMYNFKV